jgi:hypothetical protein
MSRVLFPARFRSRARDAIQILSLDEASTEAGDVRSGRGVVLVTNDRGKKDRTMLDAIAQHHVHALFVYPDLHATPAHELALRLQP